MTRIEELESIYCELHKDVYGVKARWITFSSVEEGERALASLEEQGRIIWAQEEAARKQAAVEFEARVKTVIESGAGDRATALRWIHQAEDTNGDDEFLAYKCGLQYGYFKVDQTAV